MAKLSQRTWALLWITQGGNPAKADEASAVVMAESGGDTTIYNGVCCTGGYQFHWNTLDKKCAENPVCATRAAIKNSNNGRDWGKWEAHTNGNYTQYLGGSGLGKRRTSKRKAKAELASFGGDFLEGFQDSMPGPLGPLGDLGSEGLGLLGKAGEAVDIPVVSDLTQSLARISAFFVGLGELMLTPQGWLRLGKVIGGLFLLLWGLRIIIREATGTDPVGAAKRTATKVGEAAALAATIK